MSIAKYFEVGTLLVWGVLDIYLYLHYGNAATESATTWRSGYLFPGLTFFVGSLMGHFFGQWRAPSPDTVADPEWRSLGEDVVLCLEVIWLSFDAYGLFWSGSPCAFDSWVWAVLGHQVWLLFLIGFGTGSVFLPMVSPTAYQLRRKNERD